MTTTAPTRTASRAPAPRQPASAGVAIDPIRVVRRHLTLLIVAVVFGAGLGYGAYLLCDRYLPRYTGRAIFVVSPPLRNAFDPVGPTGDREESVVRIGRTEIERLLSREMLGTVLNRSREIREQTVWGRNFVDESGNFAVEDAIDDLLEDLRADMVRNANLFYLEWSAAVASDIPVVLNDIASTYTTIRQAEDRARFDVIMREWTNQAGAFETTASGIQSDIDRFVREHNITASDPRSNQLMKTVEDLLGRINAAKSNLTVAESTRGQTEAKLVGAIEPSEDDRRMAEEDPLIRSMMANINDLRISLSASRERFGDEHQQIISLEQRLRAAEVEREVAVRDTIRRNLDGRLKSAQLQIEQLEAMIRDLETEYREREGQLNEFTALLLRLAEMERRRDRAEEGRKRFEDARSSAETLQARQDVARVELHIRPTTPRERSFPRRNIFVIAGAMGLLGLTLGLVFLRELLDQRVRGGSDLAVIPGARVLGIIPDLQDDPTRCTQAEMVVRDRPQSVMAEAYRQAMVPLTKTMDTSGHQTLLVLGGMPESGASTVAVNIAASDAARGQRVLLIDANFRRPRVAAIVGVRDDLPGLGDILAGTATIDEAVQPAGESLWAISAGTPATRIIERLTTSAVDVLLADLRARYDVVIIDAPPAVVASEAMSLANKTDAVVLVVRANQEQRGLVARLVHQLADLRSDFMGIILNRPRNTAGGYLRKNYDTIAGYARAN